jgi:cell pole-organizing protein PopZ
VTMAQPSSMQREPTMEEILASIRRIIEDGDQGISKPAATNVEPAAPVRDAAPQARVQEPVAPRVEAADETVDDVEAFRRDVELEEIVAETPRAAQKEAPRAAAVDMPTMPRSLAEVQASLRQSSPEPQAEPAAPAATVATSAPEEVKAETPEPVREEVVEQPRPAAAEAPAAPAAAETRPSIISEQAGRQVAAAFGELSEVFAASRKRSFDEMAEEMIRPMLREWMDNNLPVLVERLVREEIERVARGA